MQIDNITYDLQIPFDPNTTEYFTDIASVNPIPSHTIIYKTITGIGATYSEIKANRHSIIVLPHISIVKNKQQQHEIDDNTFAVYGEITVEKVHQYLTKDAQIKKFLTTPKGVDKIIGALKLTSAKYNYQDEFFMLIDECHKLLQDTDYRKDMLGLMEHFFDFKSKAMISATPIPASDPRFNKQGFEHVRVYPEGDYRKEIKLIHANSILSSLQNHLSSTTAEHHCIFFNSIDGIKEVLHKLDMEDDFKIFCSEESRKMLHALKELNVTSQLDGLVKYNFFTSSFFNGLDIHLDHEDVDVIILSDISFRDHTLIDPFTDTLQIVGRFRKGYKSITHINNSSASTNTLTLEQVKENIRNGKAVFEAITTLKQSFAGPEIETFFKQALNAIKPYGNLVDDGGDFSYFLLDNHLNDHRVKQYYLNPSKLKEAYWGSRLFKVEEDRQSYKKKQKLSLTKDGLKYRTDTNRKFADLMLELEDFRSSGVYEEQQKEFEMVTPIIFDGYNRLGYEHLVELGFQKKEVVKALLKLDVKEKKNALPALTLIYNTFFLNRTYLMPELKEELQKIFDELGILEKAKGTDIELYFHTKKITEHDKKGKSYRAYILQERKLNPVKQFQRT